MEKDSQDSVFYVFWMKIFFLHFAFLKSLHHKATPRKAWFTVFDVEF